MVSCCRRTRFLSSALAATNPWEYYYYKYVYLAKRSGKLQSSLFSALNYTLCVNIMQLWSLCQLVTGWGCGRGCGHVPACLSSFFSSSVSHNEIGHKQSLLLGALRFIYIWLFQSAFHSAIGEEEVTSRPSTRCCLAIVCLGRKVNEKAAAVDGECVLYWVSDITQYNINTKSYLLGTPQKKV